jgi:hypothetical protein
VAGSGWMKLSALTQRLRLDQASRVEWKRAR